MSDKHLLSRRRVLEYGNGLLAIAMIPAPALAAPTDADAAHQALFAIERNRGSGGPQSTAHF